MIRQNYYMIQNNYNNEFILGEHVLFWSGPQFIVWRGKKGQISYEMDA